MKNFLNLSKVINYWIRKILFLRYYLSKFYKNFVYLYIYICIKKLNTKDTIGLNLTR